MAGGLGRTMLGFADEVWEGMSKGVGDAASKKVGMTILKSNMSKQQKAALRNLRKGVGDQGQAASRAVAKSKTVFTNTKNESIKIFNNLNRPDMANVVRNKKGIPAGRTLNRRGGTRVGSSRNTFGVRLGDAIGAGYREAYQGAKTGGVKGATSAFKKAHLNADGSLNKARVAGTFAATSVAARVATGGGLYKDRNGNNNIAGLPFI